MHSPAAGGGATGLSGAVGLTGTAVACGEEGAGEAAEEEPPRGKGAGDFEAVTGFAGLEVVAGEAHGCI